MATNISASGKGDLLRQEIVQQLKQYFKLLTLSLQSTQCKYDKPRSLWASTSHAVMTQSINQSINQSFIQSINQSNNQSSKQAVYYQNVDEVSLHIRRGYRMVFASNCEHARSAFILASTSSAQTCLASSEYFKNTDGEQRAILDFSGRNLDLFLLKRNVLRQAIWLTLFNQSQQLTANCAFLAMMSNYVR